MNLIEIIIAGFIGGILAVIFFKLMTKSIESGDKAWIRESNNRIYQYGRSLGIPHEEIIKYMHKGSKIEEYEK